MSLFQRQWNEAIQGRLDVTTRMLGQMKEVKLMGVSEKQHAAVRNLRRLEIATSTKMRQLLVWVIVLCE